jgi:hypothetical protein
MPDPPVTLPQGTLDLLILKALALEPLHGWAISERLQQISSDALRVGQGSLYPSLHRLERRGLLMKWRTTDANRRAKCYELTRRAARLPGPPRTGGGCRPRRRRPRPRVEAAMLGISGSDSARWRFRRIADLDDEIGFIANRATEVTPRRTRSRGGESSVSCGLRRPVVR